MLDAINKVVLHIEENFHEELNKAIIESKKGYTYNHIRKRFKVLVGMTMDKYRIRRQIALILNEINLSGKFIKDCNLEPWSDYNSFRLACEREYSCSPSALIKSYAFILQDKIDVNKIQKDRKCSVLQSHK
ncbi:hypothetical protein [Lysinibacillus sp. NPDC093692]|uniref:hypothetical protein n=1 Tax=Lysinibacillus sp. NPDC093692 TaxID=3390578 RepID=UPI003CFD3F11